MPPPNCPPAGYTLPGFVSIDVDEPPNGGYYNLLLIAEGFADSASFEAKCDVFVKAMQAEGWYADAKSIGRPINVWRCAIDSSASPVPLGFTGGAVASTMTPPPVSFATEYGLLGQTNALMGDEGAIRQLMCAVSAGGPLAPADAPGLFHGTLVLVNYDLAGGYCGGGEIGWTATDSKFTDIALHELGHVFGLADEYEAPVNTGDLPGGTIFRDWNAVGRTSAVAFTNLPWQRSLTEKVANLVAYPPKGDCSNVDVAQPRKSWAYIGAFEGAGEFHCDCFRPCRHCRMRDHTHKYCRLCRMFIAAMLSGSVSPVG